MMDERQRIEFRSRDELRKWLKRHGATADSFWLVTFKKHVTERYLPYDEVVEELLCFGWVDSRTRRLDEDRTMLLVTPRKAGSTWSASNKRRVSRLVASGLMRPAGQALIDMAKKDGSWTFLDDIEKLIVPDDLAAQLKKNGRARKNFESFNAAAKKVILLWIKTARQPATREKRVNETVRLAAKNIKAAHPEAKGR